MRKRLTIAMVALGMLVFWVGASTASCSNTWIVGEGPEIPGTGERMRSHLLFFTEPGTHESLEQEDVLLVFWELWVMEGFHLGDTFAKAREVVVYKDKPPVNVWTNDHYVSWFGADAWEVPVIQVGVFMVEEGFGTQVASSDFEPSSMPGKWHWDDYNHHTKGESLLLVEMSQESSGERGEMSWRVANKGNGIVCSWFIEHKTYEEVPYFKLTLCP